MAESAIYCPQCGPENLPESQFCGGCGAALLPPNEPEEPVVHVREPALPSARTSAASGKGPPAGRWQRVVMGLAAVILLAAGLLIFLGVVHKARDIDMKILGFGIEALLVLSATGFGFAAVRPPGGNMRRLIVGAAVLSIVLPLALVSFVIVILLLFRFS